MPNIHTKTGEVYTPSDDLKILVWSDRGIYVFNTFIRKVRNVQAAMIFSYIQQKFSFEQHLMVELNGKLWFPRTYKDMASDLTPLLGHVFDVTPGKVSYAINHLKKIHILETVVKKFNGSPTVHVRIVDGEEHPEDHPPIDYVDPLEDVVQYPDYVELVVDNSSRGKN